MRNGSSHLKHSIRVSNSALNTTARTGLVLVNALFRMRTVAAVLLLWSSTGLAQSNDVFSFYTSASTPLTGYRVAVVSVSPIWVVGSGRSRFGIEECSYWTDSAGPIPWAASRMRQPGDKLHRYTRFCLGHVSVSIPPSPISLAVLAGFVVVACGRILIARSTRGRTQTNAEPIKQSFCMGG